MSRKLIANKGYTLEVVSWENDGDNYSTKHYTVSTVEEARALSTICTELFASSSNNGGGIGNICADEGLAESVIVKYIDDNPDIVKYLGEDCDYECISDFNYEVLGVSEYYSSRVCESVVITYLPDDVYAEMV